MQSNLELELRYKTACFTGHRHIQKDILPKIMVKLENTIVELINQGVIYYGCGGALGFDILAGYTIIKLKEKYPQIKLIMVLPCEEQDKLWDENDKKVYRTLLSLADKCRFLQVVYDNECMMKRNRHLVDKSNICIAYLTENRGGTFGTVNYANKQTVKVINIAEFD